MPDGGKNVQDAVLLIRFIGSISLCYLFRAFGSVFGCLWNFTFLHTHTTGPWCRGNQSQSILLFLSQSDHSTLTLGKSNWQSRRACVFTRPLRAELDCRRDSWILFGALLDFLSDKACLSSRLDLSSDDMIDMSAQALVTKDFQYIWYAALSVTIATTEILPLLVQPDLAPWTPIPIKKRQKAATVTGTSQTGLQWSDKSQNCCLYHLLLIFAYRPLFLPEFISISLYISSFKS